MNKLDALYQKLAEDIFGYISYDDSLSIKMGQRFFITIDAILQDKQLELIHTDFYETYIMCLNLMQKRGYEKIDWGTSIRFAWFWCDEEGYWSKEDYNEMIDIYNEIRGLLNSGRDTEKNIN